MDSEKLTLTCKECGTTFQCKAPSAPGNYSVSCTKPECRGKVSFRYPIESERQAEPKSEVKFGLLENGSYRFKCENEACNQTVLVPANMVKVGQNTVKCPRCQTEHRFEVVPTESDLLRCQSADCKGVLEKPERGDGIYSSICEECGQEYSLIIQGGRVVKVIQKTPLPPPPVHPLLMKLVVGRLLGKREYPLKKGIHYIGRFDNVNKSDFEIKDKYASSKSVRIDVNENGGSLIYKLTVERALNPVYHNSRELAIGDVVYLAYGDTLKLGKTLIKVQKNAK